jgi:protein-disulfide isomerase
MIQSESGRLALPVEQDDHVQGPADAPVTLVEYADFQCPYCGMAEPVVKQLREQFADRLRLVFREYPLTDSHRYAYGAAEAAEAAGGQGKFWEMHDLLFAHQDALDSGHLTRYASSLGLDVERFEEQMSSDALGDKIERDVRSGDESGVPGTPTFFINERMYDGPPTLHALSQAVKEALGES